MQESPPLEGIKVVEFGQYIAVPAAAQVLRDLGAEVIKVETAKGDPARWTGWTQDDFGPMFAPFNRGKRSIVLDLSTDQGKQQAFKLATQADVVLQNARPGAMARAGLAPDSLRQAVPRLIVATVTGFGIDSAFAERVGLDIAAQAESGMMSINGPGEATPTRVGFPLVDVMTSQNLSNAVLAALVRRGVTGVGATINLSLLDVATASMAWSWAEYALTEKMPIRSGNGQPMAAPAADVIPSADGAVVLSAYTDAHFQKLGEAIGQSGLANDPRYKTNAERVAHRSHLLATLAQAFAAFTSAQLCERLGNAGLVIAAVRNFSQVRQGANGLSSNLFVQVSSPSKGTLEIPATPFHLDGVSTRPTSLPAIGEHTEEILASLDQSVAKPRAI